MKLSVIGCERLDDCDCAVTERLAALKQELRPVPDVSQNKDSKPNDEIQAANNAKPKHGDKASLVPSR
jgi:hypothetical protein